MSQVREVRQVSSWLTEPDGYRIELVQMAGRHQA
jgi:hypothetical protein